MKQEHSISTGSAYPDIAVQHEGGARMAGGLEGGPANEDDALGGGGGSPHLPGGAAALEAETPPRYPLMRKVRAVLCHLVCWTQLVFMSSDNDSAAACCGIIVGAPCPAVP